MREVVQVVVKLASGVAALCGVVAAIVTGVWLWALVAALQTALGRLGQ